jgi:hypothetical protein
MNRTHRPKTLDKLNHLYQAGNFRAFGEHSMCIGRALQEHLP